MPRSLIAGANAWFRAAESRRRDRILDDPWAVHLAERDPRVQAIRFGRFLLPPLRREIEALQTAHCVRHRAIDERVLAAVRDGYRQIVMIGAGYDMRASRLELEGARVIEIDHPETQARKVAILARVGLRERAQVRRVALDLAREDLRGYDAGQPTCFVAEGLIHYLTRARLEALLSAPATRRRFVLSYIDSEMILRAGPVFRTLVRAVREIPRLHFTTDEMQALLRAHGLERFRAWDGAAQVAELAPQARDRRFSLSQTVAEAES